ncbi:MAG TPA: hypothetical protein VGK25_06875 [Ignavibacteria bacterium]|jgi:hypothetical protein
MLKADRRIWFRYLILVLIFCVTCSLQSQIIDTDTSDVVIRKTSKEKPLDFNISDVVVKMNKEKTKYIVRADLDIPVTTALKLNVADSSEQIIMYLINDLTFKPAVYRVKWEMAKCFGTELDCYSTGKYLCEFETEQFIYRKDFYIK